jgi:hypothetical protein
MAVFEVLVLLVLGFFNFLVGIPVGYGFGLPTATIYLASLIGCVGGTVALVYLGDRLMAPFRRAWSALVRRLLPGRAGAEDADEQPDNRRTALIRALTERHGALGLGLAGPWIIGGPPTALLGVALDLRRRELALGLAVTLTVMVTGYMVIVHAALR